jgi:hypothetical protein
MSSLTACLLSLLRLQTLKGHIAGAEGRDFNEAIPREKGVDIDIFQ